MMTTKPLTRTHAPSPRLKMRVLLTRTLLLLLLLSGFDAAARAQSSKLPAPDKIVGEYLKAVGGKGRVASLRDVTYDWAVLREGREAGTARTHSKATGALRTDFLLADGEWDAAANSRSAWLRARDGRLSTLTDREAFAARLQAMLEPVHFADYKKQKVLARTVGREELADGLAYTVEFATRAGARLRYWFDAQSKLLVQSSDEARKTRVRYTDWRAREGSPLKLEPHRVEIERAGEPVLTLTLKSASYNTGLAESFFEPPADATLDIPVLLRDLSKNQEETDKRINDYTFTRKVTERELDDKGVLKKEKVTVFEVYPFAGYGWVHKLVSENGVPLTPEREAKELKRVAEELEKAEREAPKRTEKRERERAERKAKRRKQAAKSGAKQEAEEDEDDVEISTFLRACEFFSPRRERFRDRDVIVFDFRPRAGFKPSNRGETLVSKLSGVIWVDPTERQVMRLEARLVESFKMGGGLLASVKPGSAFLFEQTRLEEGIWLPRYSQVNASARVMLFKGLSINETNEFSDFKRFSTKTGEDKLNAPKKEGENPPQP